MEVISM